MVTRDTILVQLIMVRPCILLRSAHSVSRCDTILVYFCSHEHFLLLGFQISFISCQWIQQIDLIVMLGY